MSQRSAGARQRRWPFEFLPLQGEQMEKNISQYIEIWKKLVDLQQHFNDIGIRIRAIAIPAVVLMLAAAGYAHKEHVGLAVLGYSASAAFAIAVLTLVVWATFYFMDRHWYHRLLNGAVEATRPIEQTIRNVIPELDLSGHIRRESPLVFPLLGKTITLHTKDKTDVIYGGIALLIIIAADLPAVRAGLPVGALRLEQHLEPRPPASP